MRIFHVSVFAFLFLLAACTDEKIVTNMSEKITDLAFVTESNETFELTDLKGEWWLSYFMYTDCTQVCPTMTPNMIHVQEALQEANINAEIIAFSIDTEKDTPEVLKDYAREYQIDLTNWTFLTGNDFEEVKELSEGTFKTSLDQGGSGAVEFTHSTNFFLVNPDGEIIKKYDGLVPEELDVIVDDLKAVL